MKVIGTNMIQNGHIDEGVQLLCLIGKTFDACNYLQSCGRWYDAAAIPDRVEFYAVVFPAGNLLLV